MNGGQYFATYVQDLEQDPFDALDFVERVAWRITGGADSITDPLTLKNKFEEEIASLQMLCDQFASKINVLEHQLNVEKKEYCSKLQRLSEQNTEAIDKVKQLDSTMQWVSTKVVHLGDQLESVNGPRSRAADALQLISHFDQFLSDQPLNSGVFTDPDKLLESADLIQKLYSISQELNSEKHSAVQTRIAHRYEEIERLLIDEFVRSQRDEKKMAEVAKVLSEFKGYSQCVDRYVEFLHATSFHRDRSDVFAEALQLCRNAKPKIQAIFPNPMVVLQKLVVNIFSGKLKESVYARLRDCKEVNDVEAYLVNLGQLYTCTEKLCRELDAVHVCPDSAFLTELTRSVFDRYLMNYPKDELDYLTHQCTHILQRFYDSKKHVKKQIQSGGLHELKRDMQARLLTVETYGGETFLSEDVAISILQETKNAFNRTPLLCGKGDVAKQAEKILDVLIKHLHTEHLDYAVELALAGIPLSEPRTEPPPYFFYLVAQNTAIVLLSVKQFEDSVWPLVKNSMVEQPCSKKWTSTLRSLESKINTGMERQLNAIIGYIRYVMNSEQKKADFLSESGQIQIEASTACQQVIRFLNTQASALEKGCDGANLQAVETELAVRFHKILLTHIQNFTFNSAGAMLLLCDLNEYRRCVGSWRTRDAGKCFEQLHALANLLVVLPDNLADAANSPLLSDVDRSLVQSFLQLRSDYRTVRSINLNPY